MNLDKQKTAEENWELIKQTVFNGSRPEKIEEFIQKGFEESEDENEKWIKLGVAVVLLKAYSS